MRGEKDLVVVSMEGERTYTWSLLLALYSPTMATMMADQGSGLGITLDNVTSQDIQQVVEALQQGSRLDTPAAKALAIQQETGQPARSKVLHVTPGLLKHLKSGHIGDEVKSEPTSGGLENNMVESVFGRVSTRSNMSRHEEVGETVFIEDVENYEEAFEYRSDEDEFKDDTAKGGLDNDSDSDFIMKGDDQNSIKHQTPKKEKNTGSSTNEPRGESEIDLAKIKLHDFKFIEKIKPGEGRKKDKVTVTAYVDFKFQMYR